jgi:hypothetical protein
MRGNVDHVFTATTTYSHYTFLTLDFSGFIRDFSPVIYGRTAVNVPIPAR